MCARIHHPTKSETRGPVLLDRAQLEALDANLNAEWLRMEETRTREINEDVEQELRKAKSDQRWSGHNDEEIRAFYRSRLTVGYGKESRRGLILTLRDGRSAHTTDFATAIREPDLREQVVTGFQAWLISGPRKCTVTATRFPDLEVEVEPKGDVVMEQTMTVLRNWQETVRPPRWMKIWNDWHFAAWVLYVITVFTFMGAFAENRERAAKRAYHDEASKMIRAGIGQESYGKALELILAADCGIPPATAKFEYPRWWRVFLVGGLVYSVLLTFRPTIHIAIGAGTQTVTRWRYYCRTVIVTAPFSILTSYIWPRIEPLIKNWFGL